MPPPRRTDRRRPRLPGAEGAAALPSSTGSSAVARTGAFANATALDAMSDTAKPPAATAACPASPVPSGDSSAAAPASSPEPPDGTADPSAVVARAGHAAILAQAAIAPSDTKPGQPMAAQAAAPAAHPQTADASAVPSPAPAPSSAAAKVFAPVFSVPGTPLAQQATSGRAATADAGSGRSGQSPSDGKAVAPVAASSAPAQTSPMFHVPADLQMASPAHPAAAGDVVAPAATLDASAQAALPSQIVQSMKLQWASGAGDATNELKPEYLGDLSVSIRVEQGQVTALLQASTPEVREWIQGHESMLRQGLADQGLTLDRLVVTDDASSASPRDQDTPEGHAQGRGQQQAPRERRQADDATFEALV